MLEAYRNSPVELVKLIETLVQLESQHLDLPRYRPGSLGPMAIHAAALGFSAQIPFFEAEAAQGLANPHPGALFVDRLGALSEEIFDLYETPHRGHVAFDVADMLMHEAGFVRISGGASADVSEPATDAEAREFVGALERRDRVAIRRLLRNSWRSH